MANPFLSSEEYDERAHQLYNEGQYDEALGVLREGLTLYPSSVELHVGVGYARLAREEYAWARRAFEEALVLEPEHEDGLAGLGETLLKFGLQEAALRCFHRILELGYTDDVDLVLQVGRSLFREASLRDSKELFEEALHFFEAGVGQATDSAEAIACVGYARHRLNGDDPEMARNQLELFGSLLHGLADTKKEDESHHIVASDGTAYRGSWDEIVTRMRDTDAEVAGHSLEEYMQRTARRVLTQTGI